MTYRYHDRCGQQLLSLVADPDKRSTTLAREKDFMACVTVFSEFLHDIRITRLFTDSTSLESMLGIIMCDLPRTLLGKYVYVIRYCLQLGYVEYLSMVNFSSFLVIMSVKKSWTHSWEHYQPD